MTDFYAIVIYRCIIALSGALAIYLGYRLFFVVLARQGELSVKTGENYELKLRNVAPGVFFALFGAVILAASLAKDIKTETTDAKKMALPYADQGEPQPAHGSPAPDVARHGSAAGDAGGNSAPTTTAPTSNPAAQSRVIEQSSRRSSSGAASGSK